MKKIGKNNIKKGENKPWGRREIEAEEKEVSEVSEVSEEEDGC